MLGRFRERFSKALCESIRSSRGPPFRETWLGNPIFWIEVVGGTLDPKNWIKTWEVPFLIPKREAHHARR